MPGTEASMKELLFLALLSIIFAAGFGLAMDRNPNGLITPILGLASVVTFAIFTIRISR
jgi:hypothetical protein